MNLNNLDIRNKPAKVILKDKGAKYLNDSNMRRRKRWSVNHPDIPKEAIEALFPINYHGGYIFRASSYKSLILAFNGIKDDLYIDATDNPDISDINEELGIYYDI